MNQDQQPRRWWKDNWRLLLILICVFILVVAFIVVSYALDWWWTGFPPLEATDDKSAPKTLWDWLGLLIIPLVLALGAFLLNRRERRAQNDIETRRQESAQAVALEERENDRKIAEDRAREDALQRYLDRMSELILDRNLGESSDKGTVEQIVASARTLAVIRSLEGDQRGRKSQVIRFVSESNLIGEIDLSEVDLTNADLTKANLTSANLLEVDLSGAFLTDANLSGANLRDAILKGASLFRANVNLANLTDADLRGAILSGAILIRTDLRGADLEGAENLTNQQLAQAETGKSGKG